MGCWCEVERSDKADIAEDAARFIIIAEAKLAQTVMTKLSFFSLAPVAESGAVGRVLGG
jgi:hypothetical protein